MRLDTAKQGGLKLLPRDQLVVTGPRDKAAWNYSPLLSRLQRERFRLITRLLGERRYGDVLELGYGSGIFLLELARRSERLYGADIHDRADDVRGVLSRHGVVARLFCAGAEALPLPSSSIDLVVAVSTLEYVADQPRAAREIGRVLRAGGRLAVVYPLPHWVADAGLRLLTGETASQYKEGRSTLLPALATRFSLVRRLRFPAWLPSGLQVYEAALLEVAPA